LGECAIKTKTGLSSSQLLLVLRYNNKKLSTLEQKLTTCFGHSHQSQYIKQPVLIIVTGEYAAKIYTVEKVKSFLDGISGRKIPARKEARRISEKNDQACSVMRCQTRKLN